MRDDIDVERSFDILRIQIEDILTCHHTCAKQIQRCMLHSRHSFKLKSTRVLHDDGDVADLLSDLLSRAVDLLGRPIPTRRQSEMSEQDLEQRT